VFNKKCFCCSDKQLDAGKRKTFWDGNYRNVSKTDRETAHKKTSLCHLQLCNNINSKYMPLDVEMRGYVTSEV
jgi:hypothetical protein